MAQELVYTSAPRGLRLGSSGFCTVACTRGMAPNYVELLESLSGYTPVYPVNDPRAGRNPAAHSHYRFSIGGKAVDVLSRVAFAGADYSNRSNKFAHHVVLDPPERPAGGPAWLLRREGFMLERWGDEPGYIERPRKVPQGDSELAPCDFWKRTAGDAGWAGVLATAFLDDSRRPSFIVFEPGAPMLELVGEALRLLPAERRWDVTFNTYFATLPVGTTCLWRCCLPGADALKQARRTPDTVLIDLTPGGKSSDAARRILAEGSPLVEAARTGSVPPSVSGQREPPRVSAVRAPDESPSSTVGQPTLRLRDLPAPPAHVPPPLPPVESRRRRVPWVLLVLLFALVGVCAALAHLYVTERNQRQATNERMVEERREKTMLAALLKEAKLESESLEGEVQKLKEEAANHRQEKRELRSRADEIMADLADERATADRLSKQLRTARRQPPLGVPDSSEKPLRGAALLGRIEKAKSALGKKETFGISAELVDDSCRVEDVGWLGEDGPGEGVCRGRTPEGEFALMGKHTVGGEDIPYVLIRSVADGIQLVPGSEANKAQVSKTNIEKLGWVELAGERSRLVILLRPMPESTIEASGAADPNEKKHFEATGSVDVPPPLDALASSLKAQWEAPPNHKAEVETNWDGGKLNVAVTVEGVDSAEQAAAALRDGRLSLFLDDQRVASYRIDVKQ